MKLRALIVEDNKDDAVLAVRELEKAGYKVTYLVVQTAKDMKNALKGEPWDVVISDHAMPGFSSQEALSIFQKTGQDIPFIILSGTLLEETAIDIMRSGAQDYITKKEIKRLSVIVKRETAEADQRKKRREAEAKVRRQRAMLEAIIESAAGPVFTVDKKYRYTSFNKSYYNVMKVLYNVDIELGQSLIGYVTVEEDRHTAKTSLDRALKGEQANEETFYGEKNLARICYETLYRPITRADGKVYGAAVYCRDLTERKRMELQLIEERDTAQSYLDIVGTMVVAIDTNGHVTMINKEGARILGYSEEEIVGKNWFDNFLPPAVRQEVRKVFTKIISGKVDGVNEYDNPVLTKEGQERLVHWRNNYTKDDIGRVVISLSSGEDITERKKNEEEIKHLASFPQLNVQPIVEFNQQRDVIYANPAAQSLVKELSVKDARKLMPPDWKKMVSDAKASPGKSIEMEKQLAGRTLLARIHYLREAKVLRAYIVDITERKKTEEQLRRSEVRYRTIVENVNDALLIHDLKGNIVDVNENACRILGYTRQELVGANLKMIDSEESAGLIPERMKTIIADGAAVFESLEVRKDGSTVPVEVSTKLISTKGTGLVQAFVRDNTERKRAEEEQVKSYRKLEKTLEGTVNAISAISSMRDPYTSGHEVRVSELVVAIAEEMGLPKSEIDELRIIAVLHDIGKVYVPSEILSKPGRLTDIEFDLIKTHSRVGYDIVKTAALPCNVAKTILQHHERLDGSGYPNGIKKDKMNQGARILAVADVVEAMSSHRPYRAALGIDKALGEIEEKKGTLFDSDVVDACQRLFKEKKFKFGAA